MRTSSLVAGSLGITLVGGGLLVLTVIGVVALVALAPAADDGSAVRDALVDAKDELAWCAAGSAGGQLTVTLVLHAGEARHVGITDATTTSEVAHCVAETLVTRPWPDVSAAATVPVRLER